MNNISTADCYARVLDAVAAYDLVEAPFAPLLINRINICIVIMFGEQMRI